MGVVKSVKLAKKKGARQGEREEKIKIERKRTREDSQKLKSIKIDNKQENTRKKKAGRELEIKQKTI